MTRLEGRVAIVTGSGRGIGRAIALKLAREGARVVVNDLDSGPTEETVSAIRDIGGAAVPVVGDVTTAELAGRLVGTALERFEGIDIIVNNAGYTWDSVIQKTADEQWNAMLEIHATAPFRVLRAASDYIRGTAKAEKEAGRPVFRKVVNVTSTGAMYGSAGQVAYTAGKAAVVGLTRSLAREWARYSVNVNCVAFGLIQTRLTQPVGAGSAFIEIKGRQIRVGLNDELAQSVAAWVPLGRGGTTEEAAGAVFLLCLPESNYITGQVLVASGGF